MYFYLFDRCDRLGANITSYVAQIIYAHNNDYLEISKKMTIDMLKSPKKKSSSNSRRASSSKGGGTRKL